jgi:hypothetical protein
MGAGGSASGPTDPAAKLGHTIKITGRSVIAIDDPGSIFYET